MNPTKIKDLQTMSTKEILKRIEKTEVNRMTDDCKILIDKPVEKQPKPKGEYRES